MLEKVLPDPEAEGGPPVDVSRTKDVEAPVQSQDLEHQPDARAGVSNAGTRITPPETRGG
jgi:hypothetical protein